MGEAGAKKNENKHQKSYKEKKDFEWTHNIVGAKSVRPIYRQRHLPQAGEEL